MEEEKFSIEKAFEIYGNEKISLDLKLANITNIDKNVLFNQIIQDKNIFSNFPLKEIEKRLKYFMDEIRSNSLKPKSLSVLLSKSEQENQISCKSEIGYNRVYLSPFPFYYLTKSNSIFLKLNYSALNRRFTNSNSTNFIKEDELSAGVEYVSKYSKFSYNISNLLFLSKNFEFETKFKHSKSERDIKRRMSQSVFKAVLSKSLIERPFIFRENSVFDPKSRINLQYSHKLIKNYVDEFNCSPQLISLLPQEDSQHHFKLSYENSLVDLKGEKIFHFRMSSAVINSLNSSYIKSKLNVRKFFFIQPLIYQLNIELGNVANIKGSLDQLRVHERLFINNFRGIENPSPKVIVEDNKTGDSLGNSSYLLIANKILFENIPMFNNFNIIQDGIQVNPFAHFNLLITRGCDEKIHEDKTRASAGFGVSLLTQAFALEIYYNAYVKRESHDIANEFSIKFGID